HPVTVNGGMPVEAAVESRMQLPRRLGVLGAVPDMAGLVGEFPLDPFQGQGGERGSMLLGKGERLLGSWLDRVNGCSHDKQKDCKNQERETECKSFGPHNSILTSHGTLITLYS